MTLSYDSHRAQVEGWPGAAPARRAPRAAGGVARGTVHGAEWVARFQCTQETRARFVPRVVPLAPPPREGVAALERAARSVLGADSDFSVMIVDDIPLDS